MLVALDFDGTLSRSDPFVRLGEQRGTGGDVAALLDRMANGDVDFEAGLRTVVGSLEGLPLDDARAAFDHLQVRPEASDLLAELEAAGHHVAIVTDAPERAVETCREPAEFGVDTVVANRLPAENEALTGDIEGLLVGRSKDEALARVAAEQGFSPGETVAIGDDLRDLPMLQAAGLGVGVDPDPVVESQCDLSVPSIERLELRFEERNLL